MDCKLIQAWSVYRYEEPKKVMALIDHEGKAIKASDSDDYDYLYKVGKNQKVFLSYEDAMEYYKSKIPTFNKEEIKDYIDWLYSIEEEEKLEEILPYSIYHPQKEGSCYISFYTLKGIISDVMKGIVNIDATSIRIDQVSHVCHGDHCIQLELVNGKKIKTRTDLEYAVVEAVFGANRSGRTYTSIKPDND